MRWRHRTGAAFAVSITPTGGGPGEGRNHLRLEPSPGPSRWQGEGGANVWLPVKIYAIGHPRFRVCRSSRYGLL